MEFSSRKKEVRRIKWSEKRCHAEAPVERGKINKQYIGKREGVVT